MYRMHLRNSINSAAAALLRRGFSNSTSRLCSSFTDSAINNSPTTELTQLPSVVQGCDYEHWLVVMHPPKEYPLRNETINHYIKTLAMALGSEEVAKKSIYSVSTKYYYAFSCKVQQNLTHKIKWEPFIDGEVVPYDDKYHSCWAQNKIMSSVD